MVKKKKKIRDKYKVHKIGRKGDVPVYGVTIPRHYADNWIGCDVRIKEMGNKLIIEREGKDEISEEYD